MFESIKNWMKKRIEKDAVKSELYGRTVYLKRSRIFKDWNEMHPPVDEYGRINMVNFLFGGWSNLIKLVLVLVVVGLAFLHYSEVISYLETLQNMQCVQDCINNTLIVTP